jgi:cytochrome o ubiquinol oxidase operon protein cyoD
MIDRKHGFVVSYNAVILGFILSFLLTFALYRTVDRDHLEGFLLIGSLFGLSFLQTIIQLIFFLHLGTESRPQWLSISFIFTVLVIVIVIGGSLWIINNLNYNLMPEMRHMPTHGSF